MGRRRIQPQDGVVSSARVAAELQKIFTSRHSDTCESLRAQLAGLDNEATALRSRIASLKEEQEEANAERMAKDMNTAAQPEIAQPGILLPRSGSPAPDPRLSDAGSRPETPAVGGPSDGGQEEARRLSTQDVTVMHKRSSVRRGTHQTAQRERFTEASAIQEESINRLTKELEDLKRKVQKQQAWMKQVDEQALKAEIRKTAYRIRLEHAERRCQTLGGDLSRAYDHLVRFLSERSEVDELSAKNDALLAYLHMVEQADHQNKAEFIDNKKELCALIDLCRAGVAGAARYEVLMEKVEANRSHVDEIDKQASELWHLSEQLYMLWGAVPPEQKAVFFQHEKKGTTAHGTSLPAAAIQSIQTVCKQIRGAQRDYAKQLDQFMASPSTALDLERISHHRTTATARASTMKAVEQAHGPGNVNAVTHVGNVTLRKERQSQAARESKPLG